jgi:hypothetical protein
MTAMTQANPALWQVIGDQLVKSMDWPGAEEMAERLKVTLLPPVQEMMNKEKQPEPIPPEVKQAMQQMTEQVQQLDHVVQQMQGEIEKKDQELNAAVLKCQQSDSEAMSLRLEIEKRDALDQIEEAQEPPENKGETTLEAERIKAASAENLKLIEVAGNLLAQKSTEQPMQEPQPDMQGALLETMQAVQEVVANLSRPKQSSIVITKAPDGSYVGERIEQ